MASFAEIISGSALSQEAPDIAGAYQKGAAIAVEREKLQNSRAQLEQQRLQLEVTKDNKIMDTIKVMNSTKDPATRRMLAKTLENKVRMYGREEVYTPETIQMMKDSEEARGKLLGFRMWAEDQMKQGNMTMSEYHKQVHMMSSDPELLLQTDYDRMLKAAEFAEDQEQKTRRTYLMAGLRQDAEDVKFSRTATRKSKEVIGKDHAMFQKMGLADFEKKIPALDQLIKDMESGKIETGTGAILAATQAPFVGGDAALAKVAPEVKAAMDQVRGFVNLKGQMDSQFGDKAMNEAFARAFDPNLKTEFNIEKLKAMRANVLSSAVSQINAFRNEGLPVPDEAKLKQVFGEFSGQVESPAGTTNQSASQTAPTAPPKRPVSQLQNSEFLKKARKIIEADPSALEKMAQDYGTTPEILQLILKTPGGQ